VVTTLTTAPVLDTLTREQAAQRDAEYMAKFSRQTLRRRWQVLGMACITAVLGWVVAATVFIVAGSREAAFARHADRLSATVTGDHNPFEAWFWSPRDRQSHTAPVHVDDETEWKGHNRTAALLVDRHDPNTVRVVGEISGFGGEPWYAAEMLGWFTGFLATWTALVLAVSLLRWRRELGHFPWRSLTEAGCEALATRWPALVDRDDPNDTLDDATMLIVHRRFRFVLAPDGRILGRLERGDTGRRLTDLDGHHIATLSAARFATDQHSDNTRIERTSSGRRVSVAGRAAVLLERCERKRFRCRRAELSRSHGTLAAGAARLVRRNSAVALDPRLVGDERKLALMMVLTAF
jgi:hypothetical protein